MFKWVRENDLFAVPVHLTYKGQKSFNTLLGGFFSLTLILAFTTYSVFTLRHLIVNPHMSGQTTESYFRKSDDPATQYNITATTSTQAVQFQGIHGTGLPMLNDELNSNFRVVFYQWVNFSPTAIPGAPCRDVFSE